MGCSDEGMWLLDHLPDDPAQATATDAEALRARGVLRLWSDDLLGARRT
jgi:hypothetical protein